MIFDDFSQNGHLSLIFSEDLEDINYFENSGMNLTFINENLEGFIYIDYKCQGLGEEGISETIP